MITNLDITKFTLNKYIEWNKIFVNVWHKNLILSPPDTIKYKLLPNHKVKIEMIFFCGYSKYVISYGKGEWSEMVCRGRSRIFDRGGTLQINLSRGEVTIQILVFSKWLFQK